MSINLPRSMPTVIRAAIEAALMDCHVAIPGQIVAWDPATNLADVAVMVQHSVWDDDNTRSYEDIGTLPGVPVAWQRGGGMISTFPLAAGDTGLLVFCSDAIGEWRATNQKSQPADASRMSTGWPVFIPGLSADVNPYAAGDPHGTMGIIGIAGAAQQVRFNPSAGTVDIGANPTHFAAFGDVNDLDWNAAKTLSSALTTFTAALTVYMNGIQGTADPPGVKTGTMVTANGALATAAGAFNTAVQATAATIARVK